MKFSYLIIGIICFMLGNAQDRPTPGQFSTRSEVLAVHGMAATSQPLATQIALDILKLGGNAVDAARTISVSLNIFMLVPCR